MGSNDPNGNPPLGPPAEPNGFQCVEKTGPGVWWITASDPVQTQPPGGTSPPIDLEAVPPAVPTMSEYAMIAMAALLGVGGYWMIRRRNDMRVTT